MCIGARSCWTPTARRGYGCPDYFEALNRDPSYHLTAIGAPMPNLHVAVEIQGNRFKIAGGVPGKKVSWK
jgi:hypothetical protein